MKVLETTAIDGNRFKFCRIKASDLITEWAQRTGKALPNGDRKTIDRVTAYQDLGDMMRREMGEAAIALEAIAAIRAKRAEFMDTKVNPSEPVTPDNMPRAYIVDSLKNPAEVRLLREVYGDAFILVGVVCEEREREERLLNAFYTIPEQATQGKHARDMVRKLMSRDAGENQGDHGQHVTDTFHESDYFIDNSEDDKKNEKPFLNEEFGRLIEVITHSEVKRPRIEETAMHMAYSAQLRSYCLSRQVGACLIDSSGNILATGTNEVPRAGGGVYGERHDHDDNRCYFADFGGCSNNRVQNAIIEEVIEAATGKTRETDVAGVDALTKKLRSTALGGLIEFSRAVHAEMDAILSAARTGASLVGSRLFVTTFPCHYCARHIVTAGVSEVHYIEPYPKSRALDLHKDSITTETSGWMSPEEFDSPRIAKFQNERATEQGRQSVESEPGNKGKVLFRPFIGVAPRLYQRVFLKDRPYKDKVTGKFGIGSPKGSNPWQLHRVSYADLEVRLVDQ